ncbi:Mss4-like protein, partial [Endogone sp. FLAS-F59071]
MTAELTPYRSIENPAVELVAEGSNMNAFDVVCPREGCRSIVLKKGVAKWVERDSLMLALPSSEDTQTLSSTATSSDTSANSTQHYWLLTNMMQFENVGFSHTVGTTKYLSCADCDIGPLGYHDTEAREKEYLIAVERARYRR